MYQYLIREIEKRSDKATKSDLSPGKTVQLQTLWKKINDDLLALSPILYYAAERVFCGVTLPSVENLPYDDRTVISLSGVEPIVSIFKEPPKAPEP